MTGLSHQDKVEIATDITGIFNALATKVASDHLYPSSTSRAKIVKEIANDIATIVDFNTGSTQLAQQVVRSNSLSSAELTAIEFVGHLDRRDTLEATIPEIYRTLHNAAVDNGLTFEPAYKKYARKGPAL